MALLKNSSHSYEASLAIWDPTPLVTRKVRTFNSASDASFRHHCLCCKMLLPSIIHSIIDLAYIFSILLLIKLWLSCQLVVNTSFAHHGC